MSVREVEPLLLLLIECPSREAVGTEVPHALCRAGRSGFNLLAGAEETAG